MSNGLCPEGHPPPASAEKGVFGAQNSTVREHPHFSDERMNYIVSAGAQAAAVRVMNKATKHVRTVENLWLGHVLGDTARDSAFAAALTTEERQYLPIYRYAEVPVSAQHMYLTAKGSWFPVTEEEYWCMTHMYRQHLTEMKLVLGSRSRTLRRLQQVGIPLANTSKKLMARNIVNFSLHMTPIAKVILWSCITMLAFGMAEAHSASNTTEVSFPGRVYPTRAEVLGRMASSLANFGAAFFCVCTEFVTGVGYHAFILLCFLDNLFWHAQGTEDITYPTVLFAGPLAVTNSLLATYGYWRILSYAITLTVYGVVKLRNRRFSGDSLTNARGVKRIKESHQQHSEVQICHDIGVIGRVMSVFAYDSTSALPLMKVEKRPNGVCFRVKRSKVGTDFQENYLAATQHQFFAAASTRHAIRRIDHKGNERWLDLGACVEHAHITGTVTLCNAAYHTPGVCMGTHTQVYCRTRSTSHEVDGVLIDLSQRQWSKLGDPAAFRAISLAPRASVRAFTVEPLAPYDTLASTGLSAEAHWYQQEGYGTFRHTCSTAPGFSGSPIVRSNNEVMAVHCEGSQNSAVPNYGVAIETLFDYALFQRCQDDWEEVEGWQDWRDLLAPGAKSCATVKESNDFYSHELNNDFRKNNFKRVRRFQDQYGDVFQVYADEDSGKVYYRAMSGEDDEGERELDLFEAFYSGEKWRKGTNRKSDGAYGKSVESHRKALDIEVQEHYSLTPPLSKTVEVQQTTLALSEIPVPVPAEKQENSGALTTNSANQMVKREADSDSVKELVPTCALSSLSRLSESQLTINATRESPESPPRTIAPPPSPQSSKKLPLSSQQLNSIPLQVLQKKQAKKSQPASKKRTEQGGGPKGKVGTQKKKSLKKSGEQRKAAQPGVAKSTPPLPTSYLTVASSKLFEEFVNALPKSVLEEILKQKSQSS